MLFEMLSRLIRDSANGLTRRTLLVEGWRGINQSYAMVNQYQLLELARLPFNLFHNDMPFFREEWNSSANTSGFSEEQARVIASIPPRPSLKADFTYRIDYPYRFEAQRSREVFVFGTCEYQNLDDKVANGDAGINSGIANRDLTIVTPSEWSKVGYLNAGFSDERVLVLPHGVDFEIYRPASQTERAAYRAAFGIGKDEFVIASVGTMIWNKGIDKLLLAFAHLKNKHPRVRLILKDQRTLYGITGQQVLKEVQSAHPALFGNAVTGSITFISRDLALTELNALYNACDCYASPYRAEGFGMTPLEAAACGVPIVVTGGGATDVYTHESFALKVRGQIVSRGKNTHIEPDLDSLIDTLERLVLGRTPEIDRTRALEFIRARFSWATLVARLAKAFEK